MKNRKRISLLLTACAVLLAGCQKTSTQSQPEPDTTAAVTETPAATDTEPEGTVIYWLAEYDLNPAAGAERSPALAMYETEYHGKVEWVRCEPGKVTSTLVSRIRAGEQVDMVPLTEDALTEGIRQQLYQPLDDYIDLSDALWDGVREAADSLSRGGQHYVVPYGVSDPVLLIYSRSLCKEQKLKDPYTLYKDGKWDWDAFMDMAKQFHEETENPAIAGNLGKAWMQSTGKPFVGYGETGFVSALDDADIAKAEELFGELRPLYDDDWYRSYPDDGELLFLAMQDWMLDTSNAACPDADLMAVPFPKMPGNETSYLSAEYEAKLLAAGSQNAEAVAQYLTCERRVRTEEKYLESAKEKALTEQKSGSGVTLSYRTEEQYDAIRSYVETLPVVYEYGWGMQGLCKTGYAYEERGILDNLTDGLLLYGNAAGSWDELKEASAESMDSVIKKYS